MRLRLSRKCELAVWRDHLSVIKTERLPKDMGGGFCTWYPLTICWRKPDYPSNVKLGVHRHKSWNDDGLFG